MLLFNYNFIDSSCLIYNFITSKLYNYNSILMFQIKENSAGKKQMPAKREFALTDDSPVVEILLNLLLTKTNKHFRGLCEGLERAGQGFIVKQCLSQQGKGNKIIPNFYLQDYSKLHMIVYLQYLTLL